MITKDITYGKTEIGTNWRLKLDVVTFSFQMLNILVICQLTVPGFTRIVDFRKTIRDRVYTPMGGSPIINFMVYTLFGGSHKLKVKPCTLIFFGVFKCIT